MTCERARVVAERVMLIPIFLIASGCGGGQSTSLPPPPQITLNRMAAYYSASSPLNLNYAIAGEGAFTLLASGSGFTPSSAIDWNGTALPTTFGDSTDLAGAVSASLIAAPGTAKITVRDAASGASSNAVQLDIASPAAATAGVIALITVAPDGSPANGDSLVAPAISATGRYVSFQSNATNLAAGPASGYQEIYERDTCIGAPPGCTASTIRITSTYDGSAVNFHSLNSAISADGRYVAFDSEATNILPNSGGCGPGCVFLRDTCIGAAPGCSPSTTLVTVASDGSPAGGANPSISPDGRFVAFNSNSPNVVSGDTGGIGEAFVRDTCTGVSSGCTLSTTLISVPSTGAQDNANTGLAATSALGRFFAFQSWATNMVPNETIVPGNFWRDTCFGVQSPCVPNTIRVDLAANGSQPNNVVSNGAIPAISGDGRLVAFSSTATNLVSVDVQGNANAYLRDTCAAAPSGCTPATSLVSVANDSSVGNCQSPSQGLAMTPSGRFVAFDSTATNLVPGDSFPACSFEDVFVRDTCYGVSSGCTSSTVRASVADTPGFATQANGVNGLPAISGDGRYVVFLSLATNLVTGGTNGHQMVLLAKTGF